MGIYWVKELGYDLKGITIFPMIVGCFMLIGVAVDDGVVTQVGLRLNSGGGRMYLKETVAPFYG